MLTLLLGKIRDRYGVLLHVLFRQTIAAFPHPCVPVRIRLQGNECLQLWQAAAHLSIRHIPRHVE